MVKNRNTVRFNQFLWMSSLTQSAKFRIRQIALMVGAGEPQNWDTGGRARNKKAAPNARGSLRDVRSFLPLQACGLSRYLRPVTAGSVCSGRAPPQLKTPLQNGPQPSGKYLQSQRTIRKDSRT